MEIIAGTLDFKSKEKSVVTIGKFDGIHKGHLFILDKMWEYRKEGYKSIVITFDCSPQSALFKESNEVLTTTEEKRLVMDAAGVDLLIELPFDEQTAAITAEDFVKKILIEKLNMKKAVVGYDCTFGHKALGNAELLSLMGKELDYETDVIEKLTYNGKIISSTYIRQLVAEGDVETVKTISRQPYFVYGNCSRAGGLRQKFGFPYCIFDVASEKVMPPSGFYYTKIYYEDIFYPSLSYVDLDKRKIEAYLFDASREIGYDVISVGFFKYARGPITEDLLSLDTKKKKELIKEEIVSALNWHRENVYIPEDVCLRQ